MGNRALVVFDSGNEKDRVMPAVYLHWNGGPESVYALLDALDRYGVRRDAFYLPARFCQVVGNFFGGADSLGIDCVMRKDLEAYNVRGFDNGLYVVSYTGPENSRIMRRKVFDYGAFEALQRHPDGNADSYTGDWLTPDEVLAEQNEAYGHAYFRDAGEGTIETNLDERNAVFFRDRPADQKILAVAV